MRRHRAIRPAFVPGVRLRRPATTNAAAAAAHFWAVVVVVVVVVVLVGVAWLSPRLLAALKEHVDEASASPLQHYVLEIQEAFRHWSENPVTVAQFLEWGWCND